MYTLSSKAKKLVLGDRTAIMGILNITPDSFSDGGLYYEHGAAAIAAALSRAETMIKEGADIIDVGGESTRPGAEPVSAEDEIARVVPVIEAIRKTLGSDIWISIDTDKADVAEAALLVGADMVNALGGIKFDSHLADVVKKYACPLVIYHIKGDPKTMQTGEISYIDVVAEIKDFFKNQIAECERAGVARAQIVIDPGIGFGKTVAQNVEIIKRLSEFSDLGAPILIGLSRKSHLGTILKEQLDLGDVPAPSERLEAGLAETAVAVLHGVSIVRTHDVLVTKKFLATLDYVRTYNKK